MRSRSNRALLVLIAALSGAGVGSVYLASAAYADHSPAGSGGCTGHTRSCYPNCWWEWTGQRGSVTDPPLDVGPCSMPAEVRPDWLPAITGTVAVSSAPPVSGTVDALQPPGESYDVNGASFSGTVQAEPEFTATEKQTAGALFGMVAGLTVGQVLFYRTWGDS